MITKSSPSEIEWITGPLPSPDTVHPDCRIIIWYDQFNDGNVEIHVLRADAYSYVTEDGARSYTQHNWFCAKGYVWKQNKNIQCWGWWKHFR